MQLRQLATCVSVGALMLVTACAPERRAQRVEPVAVAPVPSDQGQYGQMGQVQAIDIIPTASRTSGAGAVIGAVLGGVVGNQFGGGIGRAVTTGAGAVAGAVIGNKVEQRSRRDDEVYRVTVRFDDGSMRAVDFQRVDDLRVGDRVKWEGGQLYRM
jgi:outer membrane lipoprotein SlyB